MPISLIQSLSPRRAFGLWRIDESLDFFQAYYPVNALEQPHLDSISHPHKQLEWYASRTTVATVCRHLNVPYMGTVRQMDNKPFLCDENGHISISHAHDYAASIMDMDAVCGIDIEKIDPKILAIRKKYLFESEYSDRPDVMTIYWCIKETGYKMHPSKGISLKEDILVQPFEFKGQEGETLIQVRGVEHRIKFFLYDGYAIAFNL